MSKADGTSTNVVVTKGPTADQLAESLINAHDISAPALYFTIQAIREDNTRGDAAECGLTIIMMEHSKPKSPGCFNIKAAVRDSGHWKSASGSYDANTGYGRLIMSTEDA